MRVALAFICLVLLAGLDRAVAEGEGESTAQWSGIGLASAGEKAHAALVSGDFETVWQCLGPDAQAGVTKQRERMGKLLKLFELEDPVMNASFLHGFEQLDPQNKLGLAAPADLLKLTDAQFLGLACGLLAIADHLSKAPTDAWFMTDRYTGILAPEEPKPAAFGSWRGVVEFESTDRWQVAMQFAALEGSWKLATFSLRQDFFAIDFARFLLAGADYDVPLETLLPPWQQLLLRVSLRVRSWYFETKTIPATLKECRVKARHRSAAGYVVRDLVYTSGVEGALAAAPENDDEPWLMYSFAWASGKGEFKEFETEAALDAELANRYPE